MHFEKGSTYDEAPATSLDLVWGAENIARLIGKTKRATFHLLEREQIPARKIGNQWCASLRKLQEFFEAER